MAQKNWWEEIPPKKKTITISRPKATLFYRYKTEKTPSGFVSIPVPIKQELRQAPEPNLWERIKDKVLSVLEPITGITPREWEEAKLGVPISAKFRMPFEKEWKPLPFKSDSIINVAVAPARVIARGLEIGTQMGLGIEQTLLDLGRVKDIIEEKKDVPPPLKIPSGIGGLKDPTGLVRASKNTIDTFRRLEKENNPQNNPINTFINTQVAYYENLAPEIADWLIAGDLINLALKKYAGNLTKSVAKVRAAEELGYPKTLEELERAYKRMAHIYHPDVPVTGNVTMFKRGQAAYELLKKEGLPSAFAIRTTPKVSEFVARLVSQATKPIGVKGALVPPRGYLPGYRPIGGRMMRAGLQIEPVKRVGGKIKPPIPKELESLAEEARKYKSAEEFIRNVIPLETRWKIDYAKRYGIRRLEVGEIIKKGDIGYSQPGAKKFTPTPGIKYDDNMHPIYRKIAKKDVEPFYLGGKTKQQLINLYNQATKGVKEVKPKALTSEEEAELRKIMRQEFEDLQKAGEKKLFEDIKKLGGIKTDPTLKKEMSDLPIDILRKTGVSPDEMMEMLNNRGYRFESISDMFDSIRAIKSMPTRYKPAETTLERNLRMVETMKRKMPKAISESKKLKEIEKKTRRLIREVKVSGRITPKTIIRKKTGLTPPKKIEIRERDLLKLVMKGQVKAARIAFKKGKKEGIFKAKERFEEVITRAKQKQAMKNWADKISKLNIKNLPLEQKTQIQEILKDFDLKFRTGKTLAKRKALREYIAGLRVDGQPVEVPEELIDMAERTPLNDMTLEQLEMLYNEIKRLVHLGRIKNRLIKIQTERKIEDAVKELKNHLIKFGGKPPKEIKVITKESLREPWKKRKIEDLKGYIQRTYRVERILLALDEYAELIEEPEKALMQRIFYDPIDKATDKKLKGIGDWLDRFKRMVEDNKIDLGKIMTEEQKFGKDVVLTKSE
ncbi:hypothetical protein DRH27_03680, partial [Candidatus Falkowbacteria bacterium]